ncbi:MAG: SlyX family protein [Polyangiaceae bacterium]|jgi:SlyX protein|nr:SlyX family protein [Polyangiaceae bacterium]
MTLEERITELEIRYTHQTDTIEQLSGVLLRQERALEALRAELKELRARQLAAESPGEKPPHEPPPHY